MENITTLAFCSDKYGVVSKIPTHSSQAWSCRGPLIFPCKKYKRKTVVHHKSPNLTSFNYDLKKKKKKRQFFLKLFKIIKNMGYCI